MTTSSDVPKAPRWITTEAGQWAWYVLGAWRSRANKALSVQDRNQLLVEAEELRPASSTRSD